ncbi:MAG: M42 family metallopeptidase [Bradyrhizobiaceae bacterium]|nr:M42 family metallopeptidase [Bradyrhizobiaceae bacterium]
MDTIVFLTRLLSIDSPTGFTSKAIDFVEVEAATLGIQSRRTRKGALVLQLHPNPTIGIAAHVDTLGFIVTKVQSNGLLSISTLGSPLLSPFEGAYVRVYTHAGTMYTGTLLFNNPSAHANKQAASGERVIESMHVRLDETVSSKADVEGLGVGVGDIVAVDPRTLVTPSGYVKSHFLDNKAGCAVLWELAMRYHRQGIKPPVELFFSTYEEVGHGGAAGFSSGIKDLLVIDMGVIGDACDGQETKVSICAKDSGGPYDYNMRHELVSLAQSHNIPYSVDVYPFYSSDGTAALRAGLDARVGLIGPGVAGSHGVERTHKDGITATVDLCEAYVKQHMV